MPLAAPDLLDLPMTPDALERSGTARAPRDLIWMPGTEGRQLVRWQVVRFGPSVAAPRLPIRLRLQDTSGRIRDLEAADARWLAVLPPGAARSAAWTSPAEARAALAASSGPSLLMDFATGHAELLHGQEAAGPLFLREGAGGAAFIFPDLLALRRCGLDLQPRPAAVAHLLAFGLLPPSGTLVRDLRVIEAGETVTLAGGPGEGAAERLPAGGLAATELHDALVARLAPDVQGQRVAIACIRQSAAARALAEAARDAGAASTVLLETTALPASIDVLQSVLTALGAQPVADASLLLDSGLALAGAAHADLVLLPWGGETLLPSRPELHRFAATLDGQNLETMPLRTLAGGFLRVGCFARDMLFDEIGVFLDEDRLQIAGPALFSEGFRAMADELGDMLEGLQGDAALRVAARLEGRTGFRRSARSLLLVLRRQSQARLLAPFLEAGMLVSAEPKPARMAGEAILRSSDIATDRLATALGSHSAVFALGLLSRSAAAVTLVTQGEGGTPRQRAQALTLLALEKWLRVIGAGI